MVKRFEHTDDCPIWPTKCRCDEVNVCSGPAPLFYVLLFGAASWAIVIWAVAKLAGC